MDSLEEWRIQLGYERIHLVAHSLSAFIATRYAEKYPHVSPSSPFHTHVTHAYIMYSEVGIFGVRVASRSESGPREDRRQSLQHKHVGIHVPSYESESLMFACLGREGWHSGLCDTYGLEVHVMRLNTVNVF